MPNDESRAAKFALKTWGDYVYSVERWDGNVWLVRLDSEDGPKRWVIVESGVPRVKSD